MSGSLAVGYTVWREIKLSHCTDLAPRTRSQVIVRAVRSLTIIITGLLRAHQSAHSTPLARRLGAGSRHVALLPRLAQESGALKYVPLASHVAGPSQTRASFDAETGVGERNECRGEDGDRGDEALRDSLCLRVVSDWSILECLSLHWSHRQASEQRWRALREHCEASASLVRPTLARA